MEKFGLFNSSGGDRTYNAVDFAAYFGDLVSNGVFYRNADNLKVIPGAGFTVEVCPGSAWINGYGALQLSRALERAGIHGRFGKLMRGDTMLGLLFNEKTHGDLLLQKKYVNNPLDKKKYINKGERQQYFVPDSHEAIIDRDTYARMLEEKERRAEKFLPKESRGWRTYPFTKKIVCGNCGVYFRRKTVCRGGDSNIVWMCGTFKNKGRAHCAAQQIPDGALHDAAARALELSTFDEYVFNKMVTAIRAPENGVLIFSLSNGTDVTVEWQNKSRRDSWTPDMRQRAKADALRGHSTRREAL